jgi:hypothetical protein
VQGFGTALVVTTVTLNYIEQIKNTLVSVQVSLIYANTHSLTNSRLQYIYMRNHPQQPPSSRPAGSALITCFAGEWPGEAARLATKLAHKTHHITRQPGRALSKLIGSFLG